MLPNYVLLDILKCINRNGLAKIQETTQTMDDIIKRNFASKPLYIFDDAASLRIRRNGKSEILVGFYRHNTDSYHKNCFVPSNPELQDCRTEEMCWHCYSIHEMRPFLANYIRYSDVHIVIDKVDDDLPPYSKEQISILESISHVWNGQMLIIEDYFEKNVDYNLKGILGSPAILQCHSLKHWKIPEEDEY